MLAVTSVRKAFAPWAVGAAAVLLTVASQAAVLRNVPQTLTQPDGAVVNLFATGDEYYNRLHDADGFTVVRDPDTGYLVYAIKVDGRLQPSAFIVGAVDPMAAHLDRGLMPDPWTLPAPEEIYPLRQPHGRLRALGLSNAPEFTVINNIVVYISFADEPSPSFRPVSRYQALFNDMAAHSVSMQAYFLAASYNQLVVSSTFYPPSSGSTVVSFKDSHPRSYYRPYSSSANPTGYTPDQRNSREWALLQAAVNGVASQVPASLDVDTNNDGYVDSVVFVVSGAAAQADWSNLLWPHQWQLDDQNYPATINGKLVGEFDFQLDGNITGSGVLCHEMTHTLGAPDLYHYSTCSTATDLDPVGPWDLMDQDLDPPQHTTAYLKWRYLGFLSSIPLITPPATVTLNPLNSATNNCARIASPNSPTEYFVVEYRKKAAGTFEASLPASGLLVYRIDTDVDGQGNACGPPDELYIYRPSGTLTANGNVRGAPFNAAAIPPRTAINDSTDPSSFLSSGYPGGLSIHDIGTAGDTITFTVDNVAPCSNPGPFSLTSPADGDNLAATTSVTLSWGASEGATSYDVYFGTDQDPPIHGSQSGTSAAVNVTVGATYFWRVVATNACAQTFAPASGTWAFKVAGPADGITFFSDDFEAGLSKWQLGNSGGAVDTNWGIVSCKTKSGHGAAWCAAGGSAAQPACTSYAPNEGTFMIAGPFSLDDAVDGAWDFDLWTDIDDGGNPNNPTDAVYWMWSLDGSNFNGYGTAGQSGGWQHLTIDMRDMKMEDGTPILGKGKVWFAFYFMSDSTVQREGAYVDNVVIKKVVRGQPNFDHWIPAVIHKDVPSRSAWWRSDVAVLNRSSVAGNLTLKMYAPSGVKTMAVPVAGNGQVLLRDVAAQLGVTADSGALEVVSDVDVFVSGR
ncbi:MAG: M6 family metalloprotease domain-containing protein, partial [Acidobacteriia bacterium]|nr:M6 family metalloprotease domain-containing protein [Terriglobia bacterium]